MTLPIFFLLHPVSIGTTRAMNVASAKLWLRALIDAIPNIVIAAPWIPYAETMIDRERGLRDAIAALERADGVVAVGGEFSRGMILEWKRAGELGKTQIDLTRPPMPGILTPETFGETRTPTFQTAVIEAFTMRRAA